MDIQKTDAGNTNKTTDTYHFRSLTPEVQQQEQPPVAKCYPCSITIQKGG